MTAVSARWSQTEYVVRHGTVDLEAVVAVVCTGNRDATSLVHVHHRGVLNHVVNVACDGWSALNLGKREVLCCTCLCAALAHYHHLVECVSRCFELYVVHRSVTQLQVNIVELGFCITDVGDFDYVWTASTHTLDIVTAIQVGCCAISCSRRHVLGNDCCTNECFFVFIHNSTTDCRCSHLCISCKCCEQHHYQRQKLNFLYHKKRLN